MKHVRTPKLRASARRQRRKYMRSRPQNSGSSSSSSSSSSSQSHSSLHDLSHPGYHQGPHMLQQQQQLSQQSSQQQQSHLHPQPEYVEQGRQLKWNLRSHKDENMHVSLSRRASIDSTTSSSSVLSNSNSSYNTHAGISATNKHGAKKNSFEDMCGNHEPQKTPVKMDRVSGPVTRQQMRSYQQQRQQAFNSQGNPVSAASSSSSSSSSSSTTITSTTTSENGTLVGALPMSTSPTQGTLRRGTSSTTSITMTSVDSPPAYSTRLQQRQLRHRVVVSDQGFDEPTMLFANASQERAAQHLTDSFSQLQNAKRTQWNFDFSDARPISGRYSWEQW